MGANICRTKDSNHDNTDSVNLIGESGKNTDQEFVLATEFLPLPLTDIITDSPLTNKKTLGTSTICASNDADHVLKVSDSTNKIPLESISTLKFAIALVTEAVKQDKSRSYEVALQLYEKSIEYFIKAIANEATSEIAKESIEKKMNLYIERAEKIQLYLSKKQDAVTNECDDASDDEMLMNKIKNSILKEKPNFKWSDVAGLDDIKNILKETLIMPFKFPHLVAGNRKPWKGILLFGLRGTGKTLLAKAAAAEACHTVFSLTPSVLVEKWLGESEKLAKYLFDMARLHKPSIIFIDEVDFLCELDTQKKSDGVKRMKAEILLQMQGLNSDNDGIILLGATSKPWDLDDTICKWFEKKIYVPLPDETARMDVLKMSVGSIPNTLHEDDFKTLAMKTDSYSGDDIAILVKNALMQPLRKVQTATHFVKVTGPSRSDPKFIGDYLFTPCSASEVGATEMSWLDIPDNKLLEPLVTMDDMLYCLESSKPSARDENLLQMKKAMEDFGYRS